MRIIHFSDTHLGYSAYRKTDQNTGLNQREIDAYRVFGEVFDYILKVKPDLVIHAGDFFDGVRPSNRAIFEAFKQIARLSSANIPLVLIAGNHSTPRQKTTGSIFKLFEYFPNVYPVHEGAHKTIEIGDVKIHAIPHAYSEEMLKENFTKLKVDPSFKYNIMVTHASVFGVQGYGGGEFKEQTIPLKSLNPKFDYIALGHYHKFMKVTDNAYYSGSTERFSFNEVQDRKGFLDIELSPLKVTYVPTSARVMIDFEPIDCSNLNATQVMKAIENCLSNSADGKICRITLQDISGHVYTSLDFNRIDQLSENTAECEIRYVRKLDSGVQGITDITIGGLVEEFQYFISRQQLDVDILSKLEKIGLEYLQNVIEIEEDD